MSETTSSREPPPELPHPADVLMHLIVAFLAPIFLSVAGGDIHYARLAAAETVRTYRDNNQADLIAIAQIIACGLTALGSLSQSMADDISLSMALRLRGNAVALNRVVEQNRRVLKDICPDKAGLHPADAANDVTLGAEDAQYETQVLAGLAVTKELTAEAQSQLLDPTQAEAPMPAPATAEARPIAAPPAEPAAAPAITDRQRQAMWAVAMTDVAQEFTAELNGLPPAERKMVSRRIAALSRCANDLLLGNVPPSLQPGDLTAIIRSGVLK